MFGLTALSIFAYVYFQHQKNKLHLYQLANLELQRISNLYIKTEDSQWLLLSLSTWLRQICIIAYPDRPVAAITGRAWIELLDQTLAGNDFTRGIGVVFACEVYSRRQVVDASAMLALCHSWLLSMQPLLKTAMQAKHSPVSSC